MHSSHISICTCSRHIVAVSVPKQIVLVSCLESSPHEVHEAHDGLAIARPHVPTHLSVNHRATELQNYICTYLSACLLLPTRSVESSTESPFPSTSSPDRYLTLPRLARRSNSTYPGRLVREPAPYQGRCSYIRSRFPSYNHVSRPISHPHHIWYRGPVHITYIDLHMTLVFQERRQIREQGKHARISVHVAVCTSMLPRPRHGHSGLPASYTRDSLRSA
ncbi:hypothetical protein F4861DRAFT_439881 [Xylaria intraflava]|nr:hypothetical protein F4861DRAFT_439881 [Xylaria intraflava]